jgi:hypothetical protein
MCLQFDSDDEVGAWTLVTACCAAARNDSETNPSMPQASLPSNDARCLPALPSHMQCKVVHLLASASLEHPQQQVLQAQGSGLIHADARML